MLRTVEGPRSAERRHIQGVVYVVSTSKKGAEEKDLVTVAVDFTSGGSLLLIQLYRLIISLSQDFVQKFRKYRSDGDRPEVLRLLRYGSLGNKDCS